MVLLGFNEFTLTYNLKLRFSTINVSDFSKNTKLMAKLEKNCLKFNIKPYKL